MKYIKLYEGFDSNGISAILSFINKKIGKKNYNKFLEDLQRLSKKYDFKLSELNDTEINYLPVGKAMPIKGEAMNPSGIYAIKYWFSVEKGYLCQTGVGNKTMYYNRYKLGGNEQDISDQQLESLARRYNITGLLTPCVPADLSTGDQIIAACNDYVYNDNSIFYGEFFLDNRDLGNINCYFYQNDSEGSVPSTFRHGIQLPPRYDIFGGTSHFEYAWSLGSPTYPAGDHCMLYKLEVDEQPLRIYKKDDNLDKSEWDYNLPTYNNPPHYLETWSRNYDETLKLAKDANFAIVLYLDDVLIREESRTDVINQRKSNKKDALALIDSATIKDENIKRYLASIFNKLGIKEDTQDLKNLNSLIKSTTFGNLFLVNTYNTYGTIDRLSDFIIYLYRIMIKEDQNYYYKELVNTFNTIKKRALQQRSKYMENIKFLKSQNNIKVNEVFDKIIKIGGLISDTYDNRSIETLEELKSVQVMLRTIADFSQDSMFILSRYMRYTAQYLTDRQESLKSHLRTEYSEKDYKSDLKKLDTLEKILIKDFLKK